MIVQEKGAAQTQKDQDIDAADVQGKAKAALTYCENATKYTKQIDGKPWKYVLLPHDSVQQNMSFVSLVKQFEYKEQGKINVND